MENKTKKSIRNLVLLLISFFIAYILTTYFTERNKWLTDEQPYPKAKEELIKANMFILPIKLLDSIPFVNEKSLILQPLLSWQNIYIKKWQDNLPDDDAEKYLGWFIFRLNSMIVPNLQSVILYGTDTYSFKQTRELLDKIWFDMEKIVKYKAKDKEFEEIRYIAFTKLSYLYVRNLFSYWSENKDNLKDIEFKNDYEKMNNLIVLEKWLTTMQKYFKETNEKIYLKGKNDRIDFARTHSLMFWILDFYNDSGKYKQFDSYCDTSKNTYLKEYLTSRNDLLDMKTKSNERRKKALGKILSDYTDENLNKICKNLNLLKGIKYGNN